MFILERKIHNKFILTIWRVNINYLLVSPQKEDFFQCVWFHTPPFISNMIDYLRLKITYRNCRWWPKLFGHVIILSSSNPNRSRDNCQNVLEGNDIQIFFVKTPLVILQFLKLYTVYQVNWGKSLLSIIYYY